MKNLLLALIYFTVFVVVENSSANAQTSPQETVNKQIDPLFSSPYLLGIVNRSGLYDNSYKEWFEAYYNGYQVNESVLVQLADKLQNVQIKVFMGTWCPDSHREVPRLYKILDGIDFNEEQLTVIAVDKYKETPQEYESGLDIQRVPTFIFYENEQELGRIVESPQTTLEEDLLQIVGER